MPAMNKIFFLIIILLLVTTFSSCTLLYTKLGGNFAGPPTILQNDLPPPVKAVIDRSLQGLEGKPIIDIHAHIVALGTSDNGAFVTPHMQTWWRPKRRLTFEVYKNAAGVANDTMADQEYVTRLISLIEAFPYPIKMALFAFDKHYRNDGSVNLDLTEFYVPNEYMYALCQKYPSYFIPVISVHPYRQDALAELQKWGKLGVRYIKWLPNSMGIDPANPAIVPYYEEMKKWSMILITHVGEEKAVDGETYQAFGNPLKFRLPLNMGVKIVMAHLASLGDGEDFEGKADSEKNYPIVKNFQLLLRLLDDPKYQNNLWADISTIAQFNRYEGVLSPILNRPELYSRLVNGSDYPLPAINIVIRTKLLAEKGFITEEESNALNYIYQYNPLLFDFVSKRIIRDPQVQRSFSPAIFTNLPQ